MSFNNNIIADKKTASLPGLLFAIVGCSCWGFSGLFAKLLFEDKGIPAMWLVTVRLITAGLLLLVKRGEGLLHTVGGAARRGGESAERVAGVGSQTCQVVAYRGARGVHSGISAASGGFPLEALSCDALAARRNGTVQRG